MRIGLGMSIVGGGYAPAPSGITYLSDVGGTPTAAYSVRKVVSGYSGSAIRVRESSGGTETDIGFDGENLDEAALLAHCGANDGFVTKWYDQSGSGYDAIQSTAGSQPKIVSAGTVIKENGMPALDFDGGDFLLANTLASVFTGEDKAISFFDVTKRTSGNLDFFTFGGGNETIFHTLHREVTTDSTYRSVLRDNANVLKSASGGTIGTSQKLVSVIGTGTLVSLYEDTLAVYEDQDVDVGTLTLTSACIGALYREPALIANYLVGNSQELIVYASDKSSLRTAIEGNINGYYSIYP